MTLLRVLGPQFGDTLYMSEANGSRKVNSNAEVGMNKNSDPVQKFFLKGDWENSAPNSFFSKLLEFSETSRARKLTLGLQVNIHHVRKK